MAKKVYTCATCGALAEEPGHLCNPAEEMGTCAYCGKREPHVKHYCKGKMEGRSNHAALADNRGPGVGVCAAHGERRSGAARG